LTRRFDGQKHWQAFRDLRFINFFFFKYKDILHICQPSQYCCNDFKANKLVLILAML
jgi:hypothetical protein